MNHYEVLTEIAEFVEYSDCVVIKQSEWEIFSLWVSSLPNEALASRPNLYLLPVSFKKEG